MKSALLKATSPFRAFIVVGLLSLQAVTSYGQVAEGSQTQSSARSLATDGADSGSAQDSTSGERSNTANPAVPADVVKELEAMKARIEQLEGQLKDRNAAQSTVTAPAVSATP